MYYLVNPLTKEHTALGIRFPPHLQIEEKANIVKSDRYDWLPLVRKERTLPVGRDVWVRPVGAGVLYYACASRVPDWSLVTHYCIPAGQKPEAVETDAQPAPSIDGQYEYVKIGSAEQRWWKVTIIAYDEGAPVGKTEAGRYRRLPLDEYRFRSPRTERQKWVEAALIVNGGHAESVEELIGLVHDALLTGEIEAPKPEDTSS